MSDVVQPLTDEPPLPESLELAGGFPTPTREQWRALVGEVLAKRGPVPDDVEAALSTTTPEGIRVQPLYTADDAPQTPGLPGFAPFVRGRQASAGGWDVRARHANPSAEQTHEEVLDDLEHGVTSLWLVIGDEGIPAAGLQTALKDVLLDLAPVVLDAGADYAAVAEAFLSLAKDVTPLGNLGADPVAVLARTGAEVSGAEAVALAKRSGQMRAMTVDALPYHEAGGTDADELGLSLSHGVAHLRLLTEGGLTVEQAAAQLEFRYAATADQFLTIAKLRAARQVWSRVLEASGVEASQRGQLQHAVTSWSMTTTRDPWTSLLRDTLATFSAGVGGADSVTVLPFDAPLGLPNGLSRRMARNTSAILIEESHVARVTDPAGGSWYVESLTAELAAKAWAVFQETEAAGGVVAGLKDGSVAARLSASADSARTRLAKRKDALTGVSEFPLIGEKRVERTAAPEAPTGGLPRIRRSMKHEALRDAADAFTEKTGAAPSVLALTFGPLKAHSARLDYVRNLLSPGGIVTEVAAEVPATVGAVVVLVASDDVTPDEVAPAVEALRKAGATLVLRAGKSKLEWPGVDDFVFIGVDALGVLRRVQDELGVTA